MKTHFSTPTAYNFTINTLKRMQRTFFTGSDTDGIYIIVV